MPDQDSYINLTAVQDFRRARRQAALKDIVGRLTGKSIGLLSYEEVRDKLRAREAANRGLEEIPIDAIVGSVGRYSDFTRDFLPRQDAVEDRWVRVKMAAGLSDLPPIEVYQIGEAYFVLDGNHRVSVARQMGATHVQAYVTELKSKVPFTPEVQPEDLIVKAEYADFLARTHLDELRPGCDLSVTIPGKYRLLEEHIQMERHFLSRKKKREIAYEEAVAQWYDTVYLPLVKAIRAGGILREFPDRTETDLYLWVTKHRSEIEEELGWDIKSEAAATDFVARFSTQPERLASRLGEKILDALVPDELEPGPPPGEWRRTIRHLESSPQSESRLFLDLLVPITGKEIGWKAMDQAILVAQREGARLHGLHMVASEEERGAPAIEILKKEFERRCQEGDVPGELTLAAGSVARKICDRARWVDLVVVNLAYPPAPRVLSRLSSGFGTMIRRCPRPILAVPGKATRLNSALLAYDGSPKGEEALFVATYVAGRWGISLMVVTANENGPHAEEVLQRARDYLDSSGVEATFVAARGSAGEAVLRAAENHNSDLIIMGGYGYNPVMEVVLGSTVDQVLRESGRPVLICR
ncbi:MAG: universal stress protein [Anaerolineales bacterium]